MPKMTREQRAYLWGRLRSAKDKQGISWNDEPVKPPHIRKAEAAVKRWEALYSNDYARALEAVKRFEAHK